MVPSRFCLFFLTLSEFLYQYNYFVLLLSPRICYPVVLVILLFLLSYHTRYQFALVAFNIATDWTESDENGKRDEMPNTC